jgi:hypothetical protein
MSTTNDVQPPADGSDWTYILAGETGYPGAAVPPRRPRRRRWLWLLVIAVLAAVIGGGAVAYMTAGTHHPAKPRASAAAPAVLTPDQILARDGFTPVGEMTKQELINNANSTDVAQLLNPVVDGTTVVGQNGNAGEVVIPISPAGVIVMNNPAMLHRIAAGSGGSAGTTARFVGHYLVITDPQAGSSGSSGSSPSPPASPTTSAA